jgi:hypothetical protein
MTPSFSFCLVCGVCGLDPKMKQQQKSRPIFKTKVYGQGSLTGATMNSICCTTNNLQPSDQPSVHEGEIRMEND